MEIGSGKTLCIPTIFVSYTGETLDYKAPLLKSLESLNKAAVEVCNYFDKNVSRVNATLGWEQEYFVVDEGLYNGRPDLVMIDGGPGQLSVACQVFADLGVENVALVSISKGPDRDAGREHFYMPGKDPFRLDPRSPVLYYLQRLRDEAHRFVIGGHRKKRSAAIGANPLDEIAGVGAGRKRALLQHFGSARAVSAASVADLASVQGVSETLAHKIYDFFHPG